MILTISKPIMVAGVPHDPGDRIDADANLAWLLLGMAAAELIPAEPETAAIAPSETADLPAGKRRKAA